MWILVCLKRYLNTWCVSTHGLSLGHFTLQRWCAAQQTRICTAQSDRVRTTHVHHHQQYKKPQSHIYSSLAAATRLLLRHLLLHAQRPCSALCHMMVAAPRLRCMMLLYTPGCAPSAGLARVGTAQGHGRKGKSAVALSQHAAAAVVAHGAAAQQQHSLLQHRTVMVTP